MMKKNTLIAIFLSQLLMLSSCKQNEASNEKISEKNTAITASEMCLNIVMESDETLSKIRNENTRIMSISETIDTYVLGMNAIDFSDCPRDFSASYKSHTKAWQAVTEITDNYPNLRGEMHELFREIEKGKDSVQFKKLVTNVWDTWTDVETAAMAN